MKTIILDTETNKLEGNPIQIAHVTFDFETKSKCEPFNQYYSLDDGDSIDFGAMAVHNIIPDDLEREPHYKTFCLPSDVIFVIGHNVDYDIRAIQRCGVDTSTIKAICTLALARMVWPDATSHSLGALCYMLTTDLAGMRRQLRNAHDAYADVLLTKWLLRKICEQLGITTAKDLFLQSEIARIPTKMAFGKHKGVAITDLPSDYVQWLLKQPDLDPYLKKALNKI